MLCRYPITFSTVTLKGIRDYCVDCRRNKLDECRDCKYNYGEEIQNEVYFDYARRRDFTRHGRMF